MAHFDAVSSPSAKAALWHLRTWARVIEKDLPGNRRRITCSSPKTLGKNSTPGSPGKNQRLKEPRKNSTSGGEQCQHCTNQKKSSLYWWCAAAFFLSSLTEACTLQVHASQMLDIDNDHRHLLTKPVGITLVDACIEGTSWKPIRSPRRFDQNWIITRISASCCWVHVRCHMGCTHFAHTVHHMHSCINFNEPCEWNRL